MQLPPVANVDYCIAKVALNMLTVHLQTAENEREQGSRITFWIVSPGHCKTAFNNYRGKKNPLDGAEVIVRLLKTGEGEVAPGSFWEFEDGELRNVPW